MRNVFLVPHFHIFSRLVDSLFTGLSHFSHSKQQHNGARVLYMSAGPCSNAGLLLHLRTQTVGGGESSHCDREQQSIQKILIHWIFNNMIQTILDTIRED